MGDSKHMGRVLYDINSFLGWMESENSKGDLDDR